MPSNAFFQNIASVVAANKPAAIAAGALLLGGVFAADLAQQPSAAKVNVGYDAAGKPYLWSTNPGDEAPRPAPTDAGGGIGGSKAKVNVGYDASGKPYLWSTDPGGEAARPAPADAAANASAQQANYVGVARGIVANDGAFTSTAPAAPAPGAVGTSIGHGSNAGSAPQIGTSTGQGGGPGVGSSVGFGGGGGSLGAPPPATENRQIVTTVSTGSSSSQGGSPPQNGGFTNVYNPPANSGGDVGTSIGHGSSEGGTPSIGTSVGHGTTPGNPTTSDVGAGMAL